MAAYVLDRTGERLLPGATNELNLLVTLPIELGAFVLTVHGRRRFPSVEPDCLFLDNMHRDTHLCCIQVDSPAVALPVSRLLPCIFNELESPEELAPALLCQ